MTRRTTDFTFNDIPTLRDEGLQDILQRFDFYTLVDALATADEPVREKVFANLWKRTAARLKTALENAGAVSREAGEDARTRITEGIIRVMTNASEFRCRPIVSGGFAIPEAERQRKIRSITGDIESAGEYGRLYISYDTTEEELRKALEPFANRRDDLAGIRELSVYGIHLPALLEFLEAGNIEELSIYCGSGDPHWPLLDTFTSLKKLSIYHTKSLPENIGNLQSLTDFSWMTWNLEHMVLPDSICDLKNLTDLSVNASDGTLIALPDSIGSLKNLTKLNISGKLERLPDGFADLQSMTKLFFNWTNDLGVLSKTVGALRNLERLVIGGAGSFGSIDWIGNLRSLMRLSLRNCGIKTLPDNIGNLEKLDVLDVHDSSLEGLPESIGSLISLTFLRLGGDHNNYDTKDNTHIKALPDGIGKLENLQDLVITCYSSLERIPESVGDLRNLTLLAISGSLRLERLPESLGNLQSLTSLSLNGNEKLKALPEGIGNLKNLESLNVSGSSSLDRLPDGMENAARLESVNLFGSGIRSVPQSISMLAGFTGSEPLAVIPREASVSYRGFVNHYYKLLDLLIRYNEKARREGLLALEDIIEDLEGDILKRGLRLMVDGTEAENIRKILEPETKREPDFYKRKLMEIAVEGVIGILSGYETHRLAVILNCKVDIKDNPIDAAWEKYRAGDRDAFFAIDFAAAIQPEGEREEITFVKRACEISELTRREGLLALESRIVADAEHDVFERGLCLIVDGVSGYFDTEREYISAALGKMIERETDPVKKNIAVAKREAVLSIHAGENTRVMTMKLLAYFDRSIVSVIEAELLKD